MYLKEEILARVDKTVHLDVLWSGNNTAVAEVCVQIMKAV